VTFEAGVQGCKQVPRSTSRENADARGAVTDAQIQGAVLYCKSLDEAPPWPAGELARVAGMFEAIAALAWPLACADAVTNLVNDAAQLRDAHDRFAEALSRMREAPVAAWMAELYGRSLLTTDPARRIGVRDAVAFGLKAAEVAAIVRQRAGEEEAKETARRNSGRDRRERLNGGAPNKVGFAALAEWQLTKGVSPTQVAKTWLGNGATRDQIQKFTDRLKGIRHYRRGRRGKGEKT
jgi:hypothetical protein